MALSTLIRPKAPSASVLFRQVRAIDARSAIDGELDLRVSRGLISEVAAAGSLARGAEEELVDGAGRLLLAPAFFDPHVHLRSPGQEHKEDIESGSRAAAAGGFAAILAMPNTDPVLDSPALLRSVRESAAREARVALGFMPAITRGLRGTALTDMAQMRELGAVGFTDDGRPVASAAMMRNALRYQQLCGGVLALHEEELTLAGGGVMHEGPVSAELGLEGIPALSESTMVARDVALALAEDARVHFQHLSVAGSLEALESGKRRGGRFSAEVTPHHLLLCEEDVRMLDSSMKVNPPLARSQDRSLLREALRSGLIDCIATDHAPHAQEEKDLPFEQAAMGTTGLETAFAALYSELVLPGIIDLPTLLARLTAGAALFELPTPRIAAGDEANLVLIDCQAEWVAGEHGWESRSRNSAFAGRRLCGRVLMTLAAGTVAFRERAFSLAAV